MKLKNTNRNKKMSTEITTENKTGLLYINIPMNMKYNIDAAFPMKSEKELMKVYMLIHKINKEITYQVHIGNHADGLSLRRGDVSKILDTLEDLRIIKKVDGYKVGTKSKSFSMYHTFNYKSQTCFTKLYDTSLSDCPVWVARYIANRGIFVSNKKAVDEMTLIQSLEKTIKDQAAVIKELKAKLEGTIVPEKKANSTALQAARPVYVEDVINHVVEDIKEVTQPETVKEYEYEGNQIIINNFNFISDYSNIDYLLFDIDTALRGDNYFSDKDYSIKYTKAIKSTYEGDIITATILN